MRGNLVVGALAMIHFGCGQAAVAPRTPAAGEPPSAEAAAGSTVRCGR